MSLSELTAAPWERTIDGRTWRFSPLSLADWAALEARLIRSRPDPIELARQQCQGLGEVELRALFEAALLQATRRRRVTSEELIEFANSPQGLALSVWLSLRGAHPELTEEDAARLLDRLAATEPAELEESLDELRGLPQEPPKN